MYLSPYLANDLLGGMSLAEVFNGGLLHMYSGSGPSDPTSAATGTLLVTISNDSSTSDTKQKFKVVPAINGETSATWDVTLNAGGNGDAVTVKFTDDASPTVAEICAGLKNAIDIATGKSSVTTPSCDLRTPIYNLFTVTDNSTDITIEADTAGLPFTCSAEISSGKSSGSMTVTEEVEIKGLLFESYSGIASGELQKKSSQTWSGPGLVNGTAGYFRLVRRGDGGGSDATSYRIQGSVAQSNADLNITNTSINKDATNTVDTFKISVKTTV